MKPFRFYLEMENAAYKSNIYAINLSTQEV